jgi:hypothetical protein
MVWELVICFGMFVAGGGGTVCGQSMVLEYDSQMECLSEVAKLSMPGKVRVTAWCRPKSVVIGK